MDYYDRNERHAVVLRDKCIEQERSMYKAAGIRKAEVCLHLVPRETQQFE